MSKTSVWALTLSAALAAALPALAADDTAPVKLDPEKRAGLNLTAIPPDAYQDILVAGELHMRVGTLFDGKELRASIFESTPAKTNHRTRPNDQDEFVFVLSGKLILTEPNGNVHEAAAEVARAQSCNRPYSWGRSQVFACTPTLDISRFTWRKKSRAKPRERGALRLPVLSIGSFDPAAAPRPAQLHAGRPNVATTRTDSTSPSR
jgi:uncharacterized cupin superfamily protein